MNGFRDPKEVVQMMPQDSMADWTKTWCSVEKVINCNFLRQTWYDIVT